MAGGKETPRQRMIGILYLVLLGLIALDVPDNLLDAFKNISDSLTASKNNVQTGISNAFTAFENTKLKDQHDRALPIYNKAVAARNTAEQLDKYIDSLKNVMSQKSGGIDKATNDYVGRDNVDVSVNLMIDNNRNAFELHKRIDATRQKLLSLLDDKDKVGIDLALQALPPTHKAGFPDKSWERAYFGEGVPMGAAMTSLTKIQSDAKNDENEVVKKILGKVDVAVVNLDQFSAVAVAPSSYVIEGQPYTAEVFLTASDSKSSPDITVNGSKLPTENGKGKYVGSTGSEGIHTWVGKIEVKQTDGTTKTYTTPAQTYEVSKPSAVVSPDKMNVLYIGVANPLSVSAPGISKEKLHVSMSTGSLGGSAGHYTATVNSIGETTVTVSGETGPGRTSVLGSTKFRIKRIPDPKAVFAGKSSGSTGTANLRAQDKLFARLENFDFDTHFDVTRFTLYIAKPRADAVILSSQSGELTGAMKAAMASLTPGSKVIFTNIEATGPGGSRGLDDIILSAN